MLYDKTDFRAPDIVAQMFELVALQAPNDLFSVTQVNALRKNITGQIEKDIGVVFKKATSMANGPPELCIETLKTFYERLDDAQMQEVLRGSYVAKMEYVFSSWPKASTVLFEILSVHAYSGSCRLVVEVVCRDSYLPAKTLGIWLSNDQKLPNFHALINLACHNIVMEALRAKAPAIS